MQQHIDKVVAFDLEAYTMVIGHSIKLTRLFRGTRRTVNEEVEPECEDSEWTEGLMAARASDVLSPKVMCEDGGEIRRSVRIYILISDNRDRIIKHELSVQRI